MRRINNALADGIYTHEEYLEQKQRILQRKISAKEKIGVHEKGLKAWHDYAERIIITTNHAYKVFTEGKPEDKIALLRAIGTNFKLKDILITFDIRDPFNFIRLINKSKSSSRKVVLRGLDSNQDLWSQSPGCDHYTTPQNSIIANSRGSWGIGEYLIFF